MLCVLTVKCVKNNPFTGNVYIKQQKPYDELIPKQLIESQNITQSHHTLFDSSQYSRTKQYFYTKATCADFFLIENRVAFFRKFENANPICAEVWRVGSSGAHWRGRGVRASRLPPLTQRKVGASLTINVLIFRLLTIKKLNHLQRARFFNEMTLLSYARPEKAHIIMCDCNV